MPRAEAERRGSKTLYDRKHEPLPADGLPEPPEWMDADSRRVYRQLLLELGGMGVGKSPDARAVIRYCRYWMRWRKMDEEIRTKGESAGVAKQIGVLERLMLSIEREFGLTPAARARLVVEHKEKKPEGRERFIGKIVG